MSVDELIEQLRKLPQQVRSKPIVSVDGDDVLAYSRLAVCDYIVGGDICVLADPDMDPDMDARDNGRRYGMPMRVERRATLQIGD